MEGSVVKKLLAEYESTADPSYKDFLSRSKITSHPESILGIRMPIQRQWAKRLKKLWTYEETEAHLLPQAEQLYDYKTLFALVAKGNAPQHLYPRAIEQLYLLADGWGTTDLFSEVLDHFARHGGQGVVLRALEQYATATAPFQRRLSVVTLMRLVRHNVLTTDEALERLIPVLQDEHYYVQMGVAWTLCDLYPGSEEQVTHFLAEHPLHPATEGMYLQKLRDSLRTKK